MNGSFTERIRAAVQRAGTVRVITVIGLAGMALILFSGLHPHDTAENPESSISASEPLSAADSYRTDLENRLTALLSHMDGVGAVTVMVTVGGSAEQVYAEEVKESDSDRSAQRESAPVITKHGSEESALVSETKYPQVTGAAILCTGGDHAAVRERVIGAASAVLGLPASRIYVGTKLYE